MSEDTQRFYQEVILRHSRSPEHAGRPTRIDAAGHGNNPMCGDTVEVFVQGANGTIEQAGYEAKGCAISLASADLMAGMMRGRSFAEAKALADAFGQMIATGQRDAPGLERLLPLAEVHDYPSRQRCATLPWQALLQALATMEQGDGHDA